MTIAAVAWRNIFRNRRRTVLNIIALTVGMSVLVLALGWIGGYHSYIYDTLRDFQTGDVQIVHPRWYAERTRLPVEYLIENQNKLRSAVQELPEVRSVTPRVVFSVRTSTGSTAFRMQGVAIDPRHEPEVSVLHRHLVSDGGDQGEGPLSVSADGGIWIGRPVAEKAGIAVGDTLFLRAMNRHGVENLYDAPVVGIFEYGYPVLDRNVLYLDLATAEELLDLDGGATHLVIRLADGVAPGDGVEAVASLVENRRGDLLEVRPWKDFARAAVSAVEGDTYSFTVMIAVVYLLIIIGILNSLSMSVHERTREIGTIRAIGIRRRQLVALFALESVWQALIAAVISLAITTPIALWLVHTGVDIASNMPDNIPVPFGTRFRADFAVWHYLLTLASGVVTSLAGAVLPARRAGKMVVSEAMRTVI